MKNQTTPQSTSKDSLLKLTDIMQLTKVGHTFIYAAMRKGTFPQKIEIAKKCVRWSQQEVSQWIKHQIELRDES